ncbi:MAG TPA: hypothetical protein VK487_03590 [Candidatus Bathyarchaeia archaeon]|nr:hypothetical protein [Candidatus Bathyarchaeia archaeon]
MPGTAKKPLNSVIKSLPDQKRTILLIVGVAAIALSLSLIVPALLDTTSHLNFISMGNIRTIGVSAFYDSNFQNETTNIQWGTIYSGSLNNVTLYLKSTSNAETILHLQAANWTFLNSSNPIVSGPNQTTPYLNLTWNYNNTTIVPGQAIPITLTLSVTDSPAFTQFLLNNDVTGFSFDIVISAIEQLG